MICVAEGLQGLGVIVSAGEDMTDWDRERIGHAIYAIGHYAQDSHNRLDSALSGS